MNKPERVIKFNFINEGNAGMQQGSLLPWGDKIVGMPSRVHNLCTVNPTNLSLYTQRSKPCRLIEQ
jgi:hypothetical protein